jgi:hypothetical protein
MRRRNFVWALGGMAAMATIGCDGEASPQLASDTGLGDMGLGDTLDEAEAAGLVFMRQEEKLARDVYLQLGELYDVPVFVNIPSAEQRHMDAVLDLLEAYGIADPIADYPIGAFADASLQSLHDELLARGQKSLEQALRVGALIEEVDIEDLRERRAQTDEAAIRTVYDNLERGSRNHLRAFVRQLDMIGVDYQPERLSPQDYARILESGHERGGRRR